MPRPILVDGKQWKDSPAKAMLIVDIKSGKVRKGYKPKDVHESRDEYMKWPASNFRGNLRNLWEKFEKGEKPFDKKNDNGGFDFDDATAANTKANANATAAPKKSAFKKTTFANEPDVEGATKAMGSFGFLSKDEEDDDDDDDDGFSLHTIPGEIRISSGGKTNVFPHLQFSWEDQYGRDRITLIIHLPSGCYKKHVLTYKVLGAERKFVLHIDWSKFRVLDPDAYGKAFKDNSGQALYAPGDTKIVAYRRAIRSMKGITHFAPVKTSFEIDLEFEVVSRVTDEEGFDGFQLLKMQGKTGGPQIFCHVELMGTPKGHYTPAVEESFDYCSSDSN